MIAAADVYRAEAEARRRTQPVFAALLDQWAADSERQAKPTQSDLFGAPA